MTVLELHKICEQMIEDGRGNGRIIFDCEEYSKFYGSYYFQIKGHYDPEYCDIMEENLLIFKKLINK